MGESFRLRFRGLDVFCQIAGYALATFGLPSYSIARPIDNPYINRFLLGVREKQGQAIVDKQGATESMLKILESGAILSFIADQNAGRKGVFVDFFGKKASTTPSLAAFYLRTHSPLIPVFCYPISSNRYQINIQKPLDIHLQGNKDEDLLKITQLCTKIIENQIRKKPVYWFWFHQRLKSRPEGEATEPEG